MRRFACLALALALTAFAVPSLARASNLSDDVYDAPASALGRTQHLDDNRDSQDRLLIVNGNSGRVVYDDGRDDLYCVTVRHTVGYDYDGRPIRRRSMNCR